MMPFTPGTSAASSSMPATDSNDPINVPLLVFTAASGSCRVLAVEPSPAVLSRPAWLNIHDSRFHVGAVPGWAATAMA